MDARGILSVAEGATFYCYGCYRFRPTPVTGSGLVKAV